MKKIFCVIGQLGNGGTERQMFLFLKNLDKTQYHPVVVVAGNSDGIWREEIEKLDIKILSLGATNPIVKMLKFRWLVFNQKPEIIFSWSFFTNAFCAVSGKVPFVGSLRQQFSYVQTEMSSFRIKMCLQPQKMVVNSSYIADELTQAGIAENRIHTIFNILEIDPKGVNENAETIRQQFNIPSNKTVIAGIGRNSPSKNFPFFVDVIEELSTKCQDIHAVLIGSGGTAVKPLVEEKGLSSFFTITGEIPNAKRVLNAIDIFFLSSDSEGLANVLVEAVDAECACVATDVGGVRDILGSDNDRGAVISVKDQEGAVEHLLNLINDPELRQTYCDNAKKQLSQFSAEKTMDRYYKALA